MQNKHLHKIGSFLAAILLTSSASSQSNSIAASGLRNPDRPDFIAAITSAPAKSTRADRLSIRVARSFLKNFPNAENAYWSERDGGYNAEFNFKGRQVLAYFTKSGMLDCVSYYGSAIHLPAAYGKMLEANYKDHPITATAEIKCKSGEAWIVTLQNSISMRKVKIIDGYWEEIEYLKK